MPSALTIQDSGMSAASAAALLNNNIATGLQSMTDSQATSVAKDFESMFTSQMLESMFGDSLGTDAFGDSDTNDIYKSMMMDAYGKEIAKSGGIGIAAYIKQTLSKQELLKTQEVQP